MTEMKARGIFRVHKSGGQIFGENKLSIKRSSRPKVFEDKTSVDESSAYHTVPVAVCFYSGLTGRKFFESERKHRKARLIERQQTETRRGNDLLLQGSGESLKLQEQMRIIFVNRRGKIAG